jgi:hypothetical protein
MIAWEWKAGASSGLTAERRHARRHAAARIRSGEADGAVLQKIIVITGVASVLGDYMPVTGTRSEGRRDGHGIVWDEGAQR